MLFNLFDKKMKKLLDGSFFIIDKVPGRTSHDEVFKIRKSLLENLDLKIKVGHSGTLDPKVTGVLVCGIGKATKALEYILLSKKVYRAEFLFHQKIEREIFEKNLKTFLGKINQLPPVRSAVKRAWREREVYDLKILSYGKNNRSARLLTAVERGTYIRKLAHDLGEKIGVTISMGDLDRIQAGPFSREKSKMIKSDELEILLKKFSESSFLKVFYYFKIKSYIYSLNDFFALLKKDGKIKKIRVKNEALKYLKSGTPLRFKNLDLKEEDDFQKGDLLSIFWQNNFLALGDAMEDFNYQNFQNPKNFEKEIIKIKKLFVFAN